MHVVHYSSAYQRNALIMIMNKNSDIALENYCTELHIVVAVACIYQQSSIIYWKNFKASF
jgi:hypothetical protein